MNTNYNNNNESINSLTSIPTFPSNASPISTIPSNTSNIPSNSSNTITIPTIPSTIPSNLSTIPPNTSAIPSNISSFPSNTSTIPSNIPNIPSSMSIPTSNKPILNIPFNRILSPVEHNNLRFLILDCPTDSTLSLYLQEMKNRKVTDVVRVCEPTYKKEVLQENGIKVHDWPFKDGGIPPSDIITQFLSLCDDRFSGLVSNSTSKDGPCIAVHCVAGLGRAPVLVAIALIESGMSPMDTVEFVRQRRRGALNTVQLQFLMDNYKRQWSKKPKFGIKKRSNSPPTDGVPMAKESSSSGMSIKESIVRVFKFTSKN